MEKTGRFRSPASKMDSNVRGTGRHAFAEWTIKRPGEKGRGSLINNWKLINGKIRKSLIRDNVILRNCQFG